MKLTHKILIGSALLAGLQFGLIGCVADVGVDGGGGGVYYGGDPWFHDGPWIDGGHFGGRDNVGHAAPHGGGGGGYIHPPRR
jgi:hypothetical protein